jgi:hypothetical protein
MNRSRLSPLDSRLGLGLLSILLVCWSCAFDPEIDELRLRFPRLPDSWRETGADFRFELSYRDDSGKELRLDAAPGETRAASIGRRAQVFVARPYVRGFIETGILKPAGAVYPEEVSGRELSLTWEGGPGAETAALLAKAGYPIGSFDWRRFRAEALARAGDPWRLDPVSCARSVLEGGFSSSCLSPEPLVPTAVPLPGGGLFPAGTILASGSPFAPAARCDGSASVGTFCRPGVQYLFNARWMIAFSVEGDGTVSAVVVDSAE